uniref:SRCR domain-containing protein n=1 Tax=Sander lucioperca TaxID=283035 RepID=A0A8C9Z899_SANLU
MMSGVFSLSIVSSIISPDSVRLVNGTSLCSGRLEVKTNQSIQRWSSVCEDDFDQQDAEVVCRELGCGAPSVLQGALYGEVEPPMRTKEFQCGGHESALLDCRSSGSDRNTCSPGKAVGLTCSGRRGPDAVRLVGGASRCAGTLEVKHNGEWRQVIGYPVSTLKTAAAACRELDCGSAVSVVEREESSRRSVWRIRSDCVVSRFALRECAESDYSSSFLHLTCSATDSYNHLFLHFCFNNVRTSGGSKHFQDTASVVNDVWCLFSVSIASSIISPDSVRLVNGTSLCSGRLEVKTNQSIQRWSSVCEDDFDQQDAEVVCRELGCGAPSVLQGALYGEVEPQVRTKEFQCGGHESALLDCRSSGSDRNTCSPVKAVGLTCSGRRGAAALIWFISVLMKLTLLVGGASRCAGTLEVKHNGEWRPVMCEDDFDQQDAEVVCRELGCGAPSVLQGALYGEVEPQMRTKEFQCGGHESALLDCRSSGSDRNTCSPGKAVGLTCSESVRLVGGASHCAGTLEVKHNGEWRPVSYYYNSDWSLKRAAAACRELDCGSVVSVEREESSDRSVWGIWSDCAESGSALRELVNGTSLCSGRLEVKTNQSIQRWSSVCEDDFDQQDAEVVCRELGCGAPSVLQGALYGEVESPMRTKEFQCGGHESALLDCRSSGSDRNTCSPGKAVGLACSGRRGAAALIWFISVLMKLTLLVGGASRCAGTLEVKHNGEWRPVSYYFSVWSLKRAAAACRESDCGSAVSVEREESSDRFVVSQRLESNFWWRGGGHPVSDRGGSQ